MNLVKLNKYLIEYLIRNYLLLGGCEIGYNIKKDYI